MVAELERWHDFYVLVGTAGATLLGLMFVAVSLGAGYLSAERRMGTRTFMSPVIIHFTCIFFVAALALVPGPRADVFAALIGVTALVGVGVASYATIKIVRGDMTNYLEDYLAYGLLPALAYFAMLAAALLIFAEHDIGLDVLAGALLLLSWSASATPGI